MYHSSGYMSVLLRLVHADMFSIFSSQGWHGAPDPWLTAATYILQYQSTRQVALVSADKTRTRNEAHARLTRRTVGVHLTQGVIKP